jgi:hypothetical protein
VAVNVWPKKKQIKGKKDKGTNGQVGGTLKPLPKQD